MPVLPVVGSTSVAPGLEPPAPLGVFDHRHADAVLDAAARVLATRACRAAAPPPARPRRRPRPRRSARARPSASARRSRSRSRARGCSYRVVLHEHLRLAQVRHHPVAFGQRQALDLRLAASPRSSASRRTASATASRSRPATPCARRAPPTTSGGVGVGLGQRHVVRADVGADRGAVGRARAARDRDRHRTDADAAVDHLPAQHVGAADERGDERRRRAGRRSRAASPPARRAPRASPRRGRRPRPPLPDRASPAAS